MPLKQKTVEQKDATPGDLAPIAYVLLAIISIQVGAAMAVGLFPVLGPAATVLGRITVSAIILSVLIRPKFTAALWLNRTLLLTYGFGLAAMNWCFYESIARIPLGIAVAIEFMGPLSVAIFTSRRRIDLVWLAIAIAGLALLTPSIGSNLDPLGVLFAVGAGFGWGLFVLLSQRVSSAMQGSDGLAIGMAIAAVALLPFGARDLAPVFTDISLFAQIVALAIVATTIPFYLEFTALKRLTAQTYGVLVTLEPAVAGLVGVVLLAERPGLAMIAAIACVTIAAIGATVTRERRSAETT